MSNRNFDASSIIQRLKNKNAAQNIYRSQVLGQQTLSNPQNSNASGEVIVDYNEGSQTTYQKGLLGSDTTANLGGSFIGPSPFAVTNKTYAPYLMSYTSGMYSVTFTFSQGILYTQTIINYQYSLNGGVTFTAFNPPQTTSPMTITGLSNSQTYNVVIRAVSANGTSQPSNILPMMTDVLPTAPTILSATPGDKSIAVAFTAGSAGSIPVPAPGNTVVPTITNYLYSTDNGLTYTPFSPAQTTSSLSISTLSSNQSIMISNNTSYTILLKAVSNTGTSSASNSVTITPGIPSAPVIAVTSFASGTVVLSVSVANNGGFTISNYLYSIDGAAFVSYGFASGNPATMTITGFLAGTHTIVVIAQNTYYNSPISNTVTPTVGASAPNPPTALSATPGAVGGTISVAFAAGANNGAVINNYYYTFSTDGTNYSYPPVVLNQTTSPITISGLLHANNYYIKLYANNTSGQSIASAASNQVTPNQTAPAAPTISSLSATATAITVNFTLNAANGATITQYQYSTNGTDYTSAISLPGGGPTYTFTITNETGAGTPALTTGKSYVISLKVISAGGTSPAATSMSVTPGAPNAPTGLSVTYNGYNYATISFTPGSDNGSAITNYTYSTDGISYTTFNPLVGAVSAVTVPFTHASSVTIYLEAINAYGSGQPGSITYSPSSGATIPAPPIITSIIPTSNGGLINFIAGANGGSAITNYYYSTGSGFISSGQTTSPITITGLTPSSTYSIQLEAYNGVSPYYSAPSNTVSIKVGLPLPPSSLSVTPGNTTAAIYFTAGEDNGNVITAYQYKLFNINTNTYTPSSGYTAVTPTGTPLSFSVSGLTNGNQYIVYVQNQNSVGWSADATMMFAPNTTTSGFPLPPTALNATTTATGQVTVTFTAGANTTSGTVQYRYIAYDTTSGTSTAYTSFASISGIYPNVAGTISLLTGHNYIIYIENYNNSGWSNDAIVNVIVGGPLSPTIAIGSVTSGNQSISFTFTESSNGGPPVTEFEYCTNGTDSTPVYIALPYTAGTPNSSTITNQSNGGSLQNGTLYTVLVKALNQAGASASASFTATPFTAPSAPTSVSGSQGNNTILLSFSAPASIGGGTLTYQYSTDNSSFTALTYSGTGPYTATISSQYPTAAFVPGNPYTVYIRAVNSNGGISPSANTGSITVITLPNAPNSIGSITTTTTQATVPFTAGTIDAAHPVTTYKYTLDGVTYIDASQTTSPITIIGLTSSNSYTINLYAYNAAGLSTSYATATFHTYPSAPTSVSATAGSSSISGTIVPFTPATGTDTIDAYWYTTDINFASYSTTASTSYTISGLTPGTVYTVYVKAHNTAGLVSAATASSTTATPYTYPGTPTSLSAITSDGGATISFSPPTSNGYSAITAYYYSTSSSGPFTNANTTTTNSTLVLTGLTNGTSYIYYIVAHNTAGESQTPASVSFTPNITLNAPIIISAIPSSGQMVLTYVPNPADVGITGYTYAAYATTGGTALYSGIGASSPITITQTTDDTPAALLNGTNYTFSVKALIGTIVSPAATISMIVQASPTYTPFTATTTWTAPATVTTINYWMVGGGGGGGGAYDDAGSGGGGGGAAIQGTYTVVPGQTYTVTVGTGGAGGTGSHADLDKPGNPGSESKFGSGPSALGGGGGNKSRGLVVGTSAGDGGPAAQYSEPDINTVASIGGNGGGGGGDGGGGGGSLGNGSNRSTGGGAGGIGKTFTISGTSFGVGGTGGNHGTTVAGADGAANTGNGGGGASADSSSGANGGDGGSGFVEIMYSYLSSPPAPTGLTAQVTGSKVTGPSQFTIEFTPAPGANKYQYSMDGINYTVFTPYGSPLVYVADFTLSYTKFNVYVQNSTDNGTTWSSAANTMFSAAQPVRQTQSTTPPTITSLSGTTTSITIIFSNPASLPSGGSVSNYFYTTDGGITSTAIGATSSPQTVSGTFTSGVTYPVQIYATITGASFITKTIWSAWGNKVTIP